MEINLLVMRKIFLLLFLFPAFCFAQFPLSDDHLKKEADTIKNETIARKNNATRLTRMYKNTILNKWNISNLTTSGTTGAAMIVNDSILNIPNYSAGSGATSASNGATLTTGNITVGGNLDGTSTVTTITGPDNNAFIFDMKGTGGSTTTRGIFEVAPVFSHLSQGDFTGNYHNTRWTATGFKLEYPINTEYAFFDGTNKSLTIGGGGTGVIFSPRLCLSNPAAGSGQTNMLTWDDSIGELVQTADGVYNYTTSTYTFTKISRLPPGPISFSSDQNDLAIGSTTTITMSTDNTVTRSITGMTGGADGRYIVIRNMNSTAVINFNNEDAGSSATNRIHTSTGSTLSLNPGKMIKFWFIAGSLNRWVDESF